MKQMTFYVEAVVKNRDDMDDFEGPLALLLHLLARNKVEIADIQIGDICDQYIDYLERMKEMDLEVASVFVQMASHLVFLKTRALLYEEKEIPELEQLIQSMEDLQRKTQYKQIQAIVPTLAECFGYEGEYTEKPPEYFADADYQYRHRVVDLLEGLGRIFERGFEQAQLTLDPNIAMPRPITHSVTQAARTIISRLKRMGKVTLRTLFRDSTSRSEVVARFVAVLELCRHGSVRLSGEGADLTVDFTGIEAGEIEEDGI